MTFIIYLYTSCCQLYEVRPLIFGRTAVAKNVDAVQTRRTWSIQTAISRLDRVLVLKMWKPILVSDENIFVY